MTEALGFRAGWKARSDNLAALGTAYWAGAAIGSLAVAADRTLGCGATLLDALTVGRAEFGIRGPWLETVLLRNPGILGGGRYT